MEVVKVRLLKTVRIFYSLTPDFRIEKHSMKGTLKKNQPNVYSKIFAVDLYFFSMNIGYKNIVYKK